MHAAGSASRGVEEVGDLAGEALGTEAELEDRIGLDERRVGQLFDERVGVAERVDRIALVADDEGWRLQRAAQRRVRCGAAEEQALQDRRAGSRILADHVQADVEQPWAAA
jgi:hypothetical protein